MKSCTESIRGYKEQLGGEQERIGKLRIKPHIPWGWGWTQVAVSTTDVLGNEIYGERWGTSDLFGKLYCVCVCVSTSNFLLDFPRVM